MRLKEFIIFIIIFTICYFLFFIIYDKGQLLKEKNRRKKLIDQALNANQYFHFAQFYGLPKGLPEDLLRTIFGELDSRKEFRLSDYCKMYQISPYEFVVVILYFEYFHLIEKKHVSIEEDTVKPISSNDQEYIIQYGTYFYEKSDVSKIVMAKGERAKQDLQYIQSYFLYPGVRYLDSKLYYIGDVSSNA